MAAAEVLVNESPSSASYIKSLVKEYEDIRANGDNLSVNLRIESAMAQLESLKGQFIQVCTTELFLEKVAASAAAGDGDVMPCPTMHELAETELAAEQEKAKLKKAKNARAASTALLEATCRDMAAVSVHEEEAREALRRSIRNLRAAKRLKAVTEVLDRKVPEEILALASRVEDHDAQACEQILELLSNELAEKQQKQTAAEEEVAKLQRGIDQSVKKQAELNSDLVDYRADVDRNERKNAGAPQLREEAIRHEKVYESMAALTRTRVASVCENGVCIEMTVDRPVKQSEEELQSVAPQTESFTYTLDMSIPDHGEGFVTGIKLSPPDIDSSLIATPDQPMTLLQVAHEVTRSLSGLPVDSQTCR